MISSPAISAPDNFRDGLNALQALFQQRPANPFFHRLVGQFEG